MSDIKVRPAREDEFEAWYPLWRGYQAFYKVDIPIETSRVTWARFFSPTEPMHCALAEADGRVVGLVHAIDHRSCWTTGPYCYLQDLFVDAAFRGRHIGRALIEHVYKTAAARGCSRVHWLTHETNTGAMELYDRIADKSGFVQYRKML